MVWEQLRRAKPLFVIAGPNVLQGREHALRVAEKIADIRAKRGLVMIFKASFDKANRTSWGSYRGPGLHAGLEILRDVKSAFDLPIITDIHETQQAEEVASVADVIQIPAFLCRQTDLLVSAAKTGRIIHIKKGQFASATVMREAANKILRAGNDKVMLCERGTSFGYSDLVVDPRNLVWMKESGLPVVLDVTHSLQQPSANIVELSNGVKVMRADSPPPMLGRVAQPPWQSVVSGASSASMIPELGCMAAALGVNGIFIEVDEDPSKAPCDGQLQWPLERLEPLLEAWMHIAIARTLL
ncbi:hypothetical protein GUITHDRAFT_159515 [Guillardia theta CCMP2712]|uniref:3-deoxy-8-phosphooctulonate synthase n=1 Tax=Guillardia theta (strain CCMP2712) TaxID=905079 RepID=L1JHR3_GUITC|nr:hypothetical protein GUITHDRAFT_159515 [Guillardia theta CCMP2712]EKX48063.1 hypothetical protein GUITHDRAFT_159515 [Guillardia theta CCMP2712]|eukprot:XP_005835043.1 hypothetical protein GUITHDRAFT_159515 [Guillardia theta CCMP2712]